MRQQHVSPSTPGKCWKQKTTKKGKQRNLDGLLLLLLQPTVDQITKEKSKCSKIRERNCWPCIDQNNPRSSRCSCCLRSKYMRELLHNDCADITDPQSYAETWLSFPSPDGSRKNGGEIKEPSLRTADVSPRSSPLTDVSRGGKSATQRQKFHTDNAKSVRNPVRSANWSTEFLLQNRPSVSMSEEKRLPFAG